MPPIYPIILSGGTGSRLWPLSRSLFPKQLLALSGPQTLLQQTVQRVTHPEFHRPLLVCNIEHRFLMAEQIRALGVTPQAILLEPMGRNTAPAAALAALTVTEKDPNGILLLLPADQTVGDQQAFQRAVGEAVAAAADGRLVTFGIRPTGPETGYGYIQQGERLADRPQAFSVTRFIEKPDLATATALVAQGGYYWNSGMFAFQAARYLAELERFEPELLEGCRAALTGGRKDLDFFRVGASFQDCKSISIDYAVMEHTDNAAMVPVEMGWSDLGSWQSLWQVSDKDAQGNTRIGDVLQLDTHNSYLHSDGPLVATVGVQDLVVVATADAVLVAPRSAAQQVNEIVEQLSLAGREVHLTHRKVYRPWGSYEVIDTGPNFQVKRITVNPGAQLSLQLHHKRAEHWVVVSGEARVTCGERVFVLRENESTFIPLGEKHRLENAGALSLHVVEVQSGAYLGEDDIVRFDDTYGR